MEGRKDCWVNVTSIDTLCSLHFQLHVILTGRFPIFPFLPTISIPTISHFLPTVQQHWSTLWPIHRENKKFLSSHFFPPHLHFFPPPRFHFSTHLILTSLDNHSSCSSRAIRMEAISSFVFHRCRSPGKKSVFGMESRASESRFMARCVLWLRSVGEEGKK